MVDSPTKTKPVIAVFDFDGTITYRDTLLPFLKYAVGISHLVEGIVESSPFLLGCVIRIISNDIAKEKLVGGIFKGWTWERIKEVAQKFSTMVLPRMIRQVAFDRIAWHLNRGDQCILVSASLEHYLVPWAKPIGFTDILGTRLAFSAEGFCLGHFDGRNCSGPEKVRRLENILQNRSGYHIIAYGDSAQDRQLLAWADESYFKEIPPVQILTK